ncbi:MAG: FecR domain-containing protein [Alphaproteobacteria bacterium]|nr:FecR domain-containing protein [Alphaproteobacteria bacterium]
MRRWQVFALAGLACLSGACPALSQQQAGVAAAVRGQVEIAERSGAVGRLVKSGEPIFLGNAIKSGADAGMQILLLDETTFTIGPNSELTIDEFVFDPKTSVGKVSASVAKGVFRFVTGKVARDQPANMQVKLPAGTIGIRGTIAMGRVDQIMQDGAPTDRQQVVLVGPGQNTESNRIGGLDLSANGGTTSITQPGFGSTLLGRGQWGPAVRFDQALIAEIAGALRRAVAPGKQGEGEQGGGGAGNAGQSTTDALGPVATLEQVSTQILLSDLFVAAASQPIGSEIVGGAVPNGISTFEQLRAVPGGQFTFAQGGVPVFSDGVNVGSYSITLDIDFGRRSVGGGGSRVDVASSFASGTAMLPEIFYANSTGPAVLLYSGLQGITGTGCGDSSACNTSVLAAPVNSGGLAATQLLHVLSVFDDGGNGLLAGTGLADRKAGTTPNPFQVADGPTSFDQLRSLNTGMYYWTQSNVPMSGGSFSTYNIFLNVNFGTRQVGGGNSRMELDNGGNGTLALGTINYAALAGAAAFNFSGSIANGACSPNCTATVNANPNNAGGVTAQTLSHNVFVSNGSSVPGTSGSGTTGPRLPGSAPLPP